MSCAPRPTNSHPSAAPRARHGERARRDLWVGFIDDLFLRATRARRPMPALLYFHGGGWISSGIASHDAICATLSARGLCRVIASTIASRPTRFPAALDDGRAALDGRRPPAPLRHRSQAAGDRNSPAPISPSSSRAERPRRWRCNCCCARYVSPLGRTPSRAALAAGWLIDEATMAAYWDCYRVPDLSPDDPRVAPLNEGRFGEAAAGAGSCRRIRSFARRGRGLRRGADPGRGCAPS